MAVSRRGNVSGSAKATIDHEEIREWVESHGGHPAVVKGTRRASQPGILRIDFPGFSGQRSLSAISWDEFFEKFEDSNLAFLYQDRTGSGRPSRFNKLVGRETVEVMPRGTSRGSRKKAVPRRWARKGAKTRAELERIEGETTARPSRTGPRARASGGGRSTGQGARGGARAGTRASSRRMGQRRRAGSTSGGGATSKGAVQSRSRRASNGSRARTRK